MITVRHWYAADASALAPMLHDLLAVNAELGGELPPTDANVQALLKLGMAWSERLEPTMVACDSVGTVIGFTLWGDLGNPVGMQVANRVCTGIGTYVALGWRNQGVATLLRRGAGYHVQRLGYDRVLGAVYHEAALRSMLRIGAKVIGQLVEWRP